MLNNNFGPIMCKHAIYEAILIFTENVPPSSPPQNKEEKGSQNFTEERRTLRSARGYL